MLISDNIKKVKCVWCSSCSVCNKDIESGEIMYEHRLKRPINNPITWIAFSHYCSIKCAVVGEL